VSQNSFVVGVNHVLNVDSIRRGAGGKSRIVLSEARGATEEGENKYDAADGRLHVISERRKVVKVRSGDEGTFSEGEKERRVV
jgi:hypothetical protein